MKHQDPLLWAARAVHRQLALLKVTKADPLAAEVDGLLARQEVVRRAWGRIAKAQSRGWTYATARGREAFVHHARHLQQQLQRVIEHGGIPSTPASPSPSLRDLLEDLRQLEREFESVEVRAKDKIIAVETGSIELEGMALGPFAVELHLERLAERPGVPSFDVVALDANPAGSDESVTHPHVKDKGLCGGDATLPIQTALRQGRICDAFCLVRSVLREYNPSSPYVALEDWEGTRCHDCDGLTPSNERHYCEHCGHDNCDECSSYCRVCDQACCSGCLERDEVSDRRCCPNCRHTCSACGCTVDCDRFVEEHDLCPECHKERQQENQPQPSSPENDDQPLTPAAPQHAPAQIPAAVSVP